MRYHESVYHRIRKRYRANAQKLIAVLKEFGFDVPELSVDLFMHENKVIRLGNPPVRIEIITSISGVSFDACYASVSLISSATKKQAGASKI